MDFVHVATYWLGTLVVFIASFILLVKIVRHKQQQDNEAWEEECGKWRQVSQ
jgi:hypothetical protein